MTQAAFSRVLDHFRIADPGLMRGRTASRSAMGCAFTGAITVGWSMAHGHPPTYAGLSILFAMIAPLFLRDHRRFGWYASLLFLYLSACASFALAAWLAPYPRLADAGFVAILFAGILCQACGPRALGCAMIGFVAYYLGLYLHPAPTAARAMLALSLAGPAVVTATARVILPAHPAHVRRMALRTVTLRARRLLELRAGASGVALDATLDAALSTLNEAALALEEHIGLLDQSDALPIRERLMDLEVAAARLARGAAHENTDIDAEAGDGTRLAVAITRLEEGERPWATLALAPAPPPLPMRQRWNDLRDRLAWRHALRAGSAAVMAMAIGHAVSPERWFWAVITIFVVFLGTRSRADTLHRGMQRLGGTLAGALASAVLATALHASPALMAAVMVLCVFGWAYTILTNYARGVFFITLLVGLVYAHLGFAIRPLVATRIEEVLAGCLIAFAVAFLLMPLTATRHIDTRLLAVLRALRASVCASVCVQNPGEARPGAAMRRLDQSWQDLRVAWRPFRTQRVFAWNPGHELALGALCACLHAARELSRLATLATGAIVDADMGGMADMTGDKAVDMADRGDAPHARQVNTILRRMDALIDFYAAAGDARRSPSDDQPTHVRDAWSANDQRRGMREHAPLAGMPATDASAALARLDGATRQLFERLSRIRGTGGAARRDVGHPDVGTAGATGLGST